MDWLDEKGLAFSFVVKMTEEIGNKYKSTGDIKNI